MWLVGQRAQSRPHAAGLQPSIALKHLFDGLPRLRAEFGQIHAGDGIITDHGTAPTHIAFRKGRPPEATGPMAGSCRPK
jgi:hypothetical protein